MAERTSPIVALTMSFVTAAQWLLLAENDDAPLASATSSWEGKARGSLALACATLPEESWAPEPPLAKS